MSLPENALDWIIRWMQLKGVVRVVVWVSVGAGTEDACDDALSLWMGWPTDTYSARWVGEYVDKWVER